jgi:sialidase-1
MLILMRRTPLALVLCSSWLLAVSIASAEEQGIIESFIAKATKKGPRQSEADIAVLKDGTLLAAWSDFYGGSEDNAAARISAAKSTDGGRTWSERYTLQENTGQSNVMSVSFLRSSTSGHLLFFYLQKNSSSDLKVYARRSVDDAKTWGEPVQVTPEEGYHVMNNARVIQLQKGRILAPVSTTAEVKGGNELFRTVVYYSDDDGRTWRRSQNMLTAPKRGAMEPGLVELEDGGVMQILRTQTGLIWRAFSDNGGDFWTAAKPWSIRSPESPSTLVRLPGSGDWLLVRNPNVEWKDPEKTVLGANHGGARTPLVGAISHNEGKTWSTPREIETDPAVTYAYTSITPHGDRVLLSYYYFPVGSKELSLRFKSIPVEWFASSGKGEGASSPKPAQ